ncbi:MAG: hypothetical protein SFY66_16845 [Oculatellaceae cyanobacterium bins.114]|nr:hypothetical protein [Oculatellaceae cyanobacterium bins.114]
MTAENQILAVLPSNVFERFAPHLKLVSLEQGTMIHRLGELLIDLYFPINCLFSITMQDGATAEVGIVGNREVLGINAFMKQSSITQTQYVVQIAGNAMKMGAAVVRQGLERDAALRDLLLPYTQIFLAQVSQTAEYNSLHTLEQRLPRWLLKTQEQIHSGYSKIITFRILPAQVDRSCAWVERNRNPLNVSSFVVGLIPA